jgi:hypothetical protein
MCPYVAKTLCDKKPMCPYVAKSYVSLCGKNPMCPYVAKALCVRMWQKRIGYHLLFTNSESNNCILIHKVHLINVI